MSNAAMKGKVIIIDKLKKGLEFKVADGQQQTFLILLTDGKSNTGEVKISIKGQKANVQILGIIIGSGNQSIHLYTFQDHQKPESISDLFIKSVLFDKSQFHYEGLIKIEKGAQKSNAYQKNQNLIMSEKAWAQSKPYLEILADDVRCTHGATIGHIDKEQLYYLNTRGLDYRSATTLLIGGFCGEILDRLPDEDMKVELMAQISYKINKLLKT